MHFYLVFLFKNFAGGVSFFISVVVWSVAIGQLLRPIFSFSFFEKLDSKFWNNWYKFIANPENHRKTLYKKSKLSTLSRLIIRINGILLWEISNSVKCKILRELAIILLLFTEFLNRIWRGILQFCKKYNGRCFTGQINCPNIQQR